MEELIVIGGGLAGSEAAWQAAIRGMKVRLYEMRPSKPTGAHVSGNLAELVCSNSLGSNLQDRASGLLKEELRRLGSLLLQIAETTSIPAGSALAVDREAFSQKVTEVIASHPMITLVREEVLEIPSSLTVIASGPLTSPGLSQSIQMITGQEHLFFFDAIAPVVRADTINMEKAFRASRYGKTEQPEGDYINCPLTREEYEHFVTELIHAERIPLRDFETPILEGVRAGAFFEGCLPVEVIASRGLQALAFGPMRPVGLRDPHTGRRPYAVVQLRQDNLAGTLYNMVGFQTNLLYQEQKRVFRLIPGLESAEFERFGQMHRNTFLASPVLLHSTLQLKSQENILFAGQITGVEGYMGNIATGLLAGINAARLARSLPPVTPPPTTMIGALCHYITHASLKDFQPMKANFGILSPLPDLEHDKRKRSMQYVSRALTDLELWINAHDLIPPIHAFG
ncbi:tRNA:m(5)U-54 methyltransferase [Anaerolinea thermolimosa]|uniref:methylenetetrahydrofolate--tRNA-(uracil(54)- C(5))-methyltransferase (FADH(2)-oxidizing) TrmFO n=1 Tax=Anaerolinea thermolimosa TaxID=229919 RepID=UPI0007815762|nr:methylenetetrahydrofolate--tRNA-(uracil(54)-C(5))-methyltransferase (FADH(2)-oxidizing) TrmFO [Anaerolinea thermolimosa]GAP06618.1 tRNA:m(5)U-54 methyltransferase [Anaerolinea thermolimosa]